MNLPISNTQNFPFLLEDRLEVSTRQKKYLIHFTSVSSSLKYKYEGIPKSHHHLFLSTKTNQKLYIKENRLKNPSVPAGKSKLYLMHIIQDIICYLMETA